MNKQTSRIMMPLIVTSILMFISLFFGSKMAGVGLTLWVLTVGWTSYKTIFATVTMSQLVEHNEELSQDDLANKRYTSFLLRSVALPMCGIGLLFVAINLIIIFNL